MVNDSQDTECHWGATIIREQVSLGSKCRWGASVAGATVWRASGMLPMKALSHLDDYSLCQLIVRQILNSMFVNDSIQSVIIVL